MILISYFWTGTLHAQSLHTWEERLARTIQHGAVSVADDQGILYHYGSSAPLIPASILKLATALAAWKYLGEEFHFPTEFYLSPAGDLLVKGFGDPLLISEEWAKIAHALKESGQLPATIRHLQLDLSAFAQDIHIPGAENSENPYDARNGALVTNFNTLYLNILNNREILSGESQTPLIPLAQEVGRALAPGKQRVNISPISQAPWRYTAEILRAFLQAEGLEISGKLGLQQVTATERLIYRHLSNQPLAETLKGMLSYSTNFTANQLLLVWGIQQAGEPATLAKGVRRFQEFWEKELQISATEFLVSEGAGLARENRVTPKAMIQVLRAFYPYRDWLPKKQGVSLKTGTLRGVYNFAGYLPASPKELYFVIMLNQSSNTRDAVLQTLRMMQSAGHFQRK